MCMRDKKAHLVDQKEKKEVSEWKIIERRWRKEELYINIKLYTLL